MQKSIFSSSAHNPDFFIKEIEKIEETIKRYRALINRLLADHEREPKKNRPSSYQNEAIYSDAKFLDAMEELKSLECLLVDLRVVLEFTQEQFEIRLTNPFVKSQN